MLFRKRRRYRATPSRALGFASRHRSVSLESLERRELMSVSPADPNQLTDTGAWLYFAASSTAEGEELWKTDGSSQNTVMVKDIRVGATDAALGELTNVNGTLYFTADDGTNGLELWKTDGSAAGTVMVKNIGPGAAGSSAANLTNVGGTLYFTADDGTNGVELWKSDGSSAGTVMVEDIAAGSASIDPSELTNVSGTLYFALKTSGTTAELWKSNGTEAGTEVVEDFNTLIGLTELTAVGTDVFFNVRSAGGDGLWVSDGSSVGTELMVQGTVDQTFEDFVEFNGELFFAYRTDIDQPVVLWKSDGTAAGTELVKSFANSSVGGSMSELVNVNGTLYFGALNGFSPFGNSELFKSDGTEAGTVLVKDIRTDPYGSFPSDLVNVDGTLYFTARNDTNGRQLWKSDGSEQGTVLVKVIGNGAFNSDPQYLTAFNGDLYFAANDNVNGYELWKSDGSALGTAVVLPQGAVSLPFGDDFNRAPGTDLGISWVETDGDLGITDGKVVLFQNTESTAVLNSLTAADVTVSGDVDLSGAEIGRSVGFMLRSQGPDDTNAYWGLFYKSDGGYAVQIYKNIGGVATPLRSISIGAASSGNLRFEIYGSTLNAYFQDVLLTTVIDTSLAAPGRVGVRQTGGTLDNFAAVVAVPLPTQNAVLPFTDNFNRPTSGFMGPFWTEHTGDAGTFSDVALQFANDTAIVSVNGIDEENVSVSVDMDIRFTPEQYSSGVIARYTGTGDSDFYMARLYHSGPESFAVQIWKNVGGVYTPLRSVSVPGGIGTLRLDVTSNQLSAYFNGSIVASTIDNSITGPGRVGMRLAGGFVDNFAAQEIGLPPVSNATLPFADAFNGPNGSLLSAFWAVRAGDLGIQDNRLTMFAGEISVASVNGISVSDVDLSAVVNVASGGNPGLLARYSGPGDSHGYLAMLQLVGNNSVAAQIWKDTGSGWENIAHTEFTPVTITTTSMRFVLEGNQLQLFVGGVLRCDIVDNSIAGPGMIGVRLSGGAMDNFVATVVS